MVGGSVGAYEGVMSTSPAEGGTSRQEGKGQSNGRERGDKVSSTCRSRGTKRRREERSVHAWETKD
jgi:hypothetical protein